MESTTHYINIIQRRGGGGEGWRQSSQNKCCIPPLNGHGKLLQEVCRRAFVTCGVHNAATQVRQKWHEARAADSSSFKGNKCKRMVRMGGDVTVLLDLGLSAGSLLHTLQKLSWIDGKGQKCLHRLHPRPIICHLTKEPLWFHQDAYHLLDRDQWALAEKEHWLTVKSCAE